MQPTHNCTLSFFLVLMTAADAFAQTAGEGAPPPERFRTVAAERLYAPAAAVRLERIEGPVHLPELGVDVFVASALDPDGEKTAVALRADGQAIDLEKARDLDQGLARARRGKVSRRAYERFAERPTRERQTLALSVPAPDIQDLRADHAYLIDALDRAGILHAAMVEQHRSELFSAISARIAPATRAAAQRLTAAGFEVVGHDELVPLVFVRADLFEAARLATDAGVTGIDWAGEAYGERLLVATGEVKAQAVWGAPSGVDGSGARVAIVEPGTVCPNNPYLTVTATRVANQLVSKHTTGVASCIASTHADGKGIAPGATILSANGADFTAGALNVANAMPGTVAAITWALDQNADILNLSYGAPMPTSALTAFDRYLDYVARNTATTIVVACGNSGQFAGDPGNGFNQIAVGSFDDDGSSDWGSESMAASSSWRNPATGVETPQVVAPGVDIEMANCTKDDWFGYVSSGTSFASPLVAGEAALIVTKQPALKSWPEAVRAIVMASAWHNIEGAANLSSKDGAGGIDAWAAFQVASRPRGYGYEYGVLTTGSFDANGYKLAQLGYAVAGQKVRVCLSYDSLVSADFSSDTLRVDLDLHVYAPNGQQVASSASTLQPFEIVQFTAPATGYYSVKIRRLKAVAMTEFFGTAFSTDADL